jgi:hypothetical protein
MTLNNTGAISLGGSIIGQSIEEELDASAFAQISFNDANVRGLAGISSGPISANNFHGKTAMESITISTNSANVNMFTLFGSPSTPNVVFTLNVQADIYSSTSGTPAFDTGSGWPSGSTLVLNLVSGGIFGQGGNGGSGAAGGAGGKSMNLQHNITIQFNGGVLFGGGGGGGGGAGALVTQSGASATGAGGGGGGGQGWSTSSGGATSGSTGTSVIAAAGAGAGGNATNPGNGGSGGTGQSSYYNSGLHTTVYFSAYGAAGGAGGSWGQDGTAASFAGGTGGSAVALNGYTASGVTASGTSYNTSTLKGYVG